MYFGFYILSLLFAYMISFYFNVCYGFMAFFFKNLWGTTLIKETVVGFLSGGIDPAGVFALGTGGGAELPAVCFACIYARDDLYGDVFARRDLRLFGAAGVLAVRDDGIV